MTSFFYIYDKFESLVTDDMYLEFTELDTIRAYQGLLLNGLFLFEFPRFNIFDYEEGFYDDLGTYSGIESNNLEVPASGWSGGYFNSNLTEEEIMILAYCMAIEWYNQQLATTENTRMKYSGSDFKFSSQANHMAKINKVKESFIEDLKHRQRLYKRRICVNGEIRSTLGQIMEVPKYGYKIQN